MLFKTSKLVLIVSLSAFVAVALIDPSDQMLHLKMPLFILSFGLWTARLVCGMVYTGNLKIWAVILLFAFVFPGVASVIALLGDTLPGDNTDFALLKSCFVILLIPIVASEGIYLTKHIVGWSFAVAAFTIVLAVLSFVAPLLFSLLCDIASTKEDVMFGSRNSLGLGIGTFYYKTVAVLLFPIAYYLQNLLNRPKKLISCTLMMIFLAAVLCSDSRAVTFGALIVVAALLFEKAKTTFGLSVALSTLFIVVVLPAGYVASFFNPSEASNTAKIGHTQSYAVLFDDHPTYLVWGQGADTEFYSQGYGDKTNKTELSYIEIVRQFGIPVTALILIALFYPVLALASRASSASYLAIPYVAYLFEAGTNPLLLGSTGLLIVSAVWGVVLMHKVEKNMLRPMEVLN
jgi:hypothetical protein